MDQENIDLDPKENAPTKPTSLHETVVKKTSNAAPPMNFGGRLKKAREQQHLSISDVADRLYLDESIIEAIESDAYYDKALPVFVCGHIRAYAKLLNIPSEEVDQKFSEIGIELKRSKPTSSEWKFDVRQPSIKDKPIRWATYAIIVILLVLVLIWYFLHRGVVSPISTVPEAQIQVQAPQAPQDQMQISAQAPSMSPVIAQEKTATLPEQIAEQKKTNNIKTTLQTKASVPDYPAFHNMKNEGEPIQQSQSKSSDQSDQNSEQAIAIDQTKDQAEEPDLPWLKKSSI
ncbi:MAG: helix-turn-helix domain-containing protein [Gammaproteobacteria bacterium]|nr:helix-turn-helix domain-containing protein [Gammaproteobacteria bacterium]